MVTLLHSSEYYDGSAALMRTFGESHKIVGPVFPSIRGLIRPLRLIFFGLPLGPLSRSYP
jgi:hypothetical protein